nr:hypothetical protein [Tanacetum cinerariifolium]
QRLLLLGKKVEAIPKSAWIEKDQIGNFLKDKEDYAELGEVCWWEIVRGRLSAAAKDHMIYHTMSSSYKVKLVHNYHVNL